MARDVNTRECDGEELNDGDVCSLGHVICVDAAGTDTTWRRDRSWCTNARTLRQLIHSLALSLSRSLAFSLSRSLVLSFSHYIFLSPFHSLDISCSHPLVLLPLAPPRSPALALCWQTHGHLPIHTHSEC